MRISDWSSDVCSSDLNGEARRYWADIDYRPENMPKFTQPVPPTLAALVGYAQHRPNLGNVEGQCPSILLADQVPEHLSAIDALRPDQATAAAMFVRSQMGELGCSRDYDRRGSRSLRGSRTARTIRAGLGGSASRSGLPRGLENRST